MKATLWFALVPGLASAQTALTLEEALATARRQAPSIVAAQAEARSKVGEWRAAQSNLGPKLTGNGFYADSRNGATLQTMGGMPDTTMAMPAGRTTVGNLMLMLPLYSGGLLESRSAAAKARAAAIEGEVQEVVAETLLAVKEAYLTALLGQERVAAQRARLKAVEEMLRTTQARFE
ncbi:MAG: TolC family protein, partial [Nitrospirae bacterium]|nr:TolC family protein [Fimbriimonadaceae bacterium]